MARGLDQRAGVFVVAHTTRAAAGTVNVTGAFDPNGDDETTAALFTLRAP